MIALPKQFAAGVDIGSNSVSAVLLSLENNQLVIEKDVSIPTRISESLTPGGQLKAAAIKRTLLVLESIYQDFELQNRPIKAVATQALRIASNAADFTEEAKHILGVEVEIISGQSEAMLTSQGALVDFDAAQHWIVVDIGGQSTEICWQDSRLSKRVAVSLPFGVVNLTGQFFLEDPPTRQECQALACYLKNQLQTHIPSGLEGTVVAVAGTATTLGSIEKKLSGWQREKVHKTYISNGKLRYWRDQITAVCAKDRIKRWQIPTGRADVFPSGLFLLAAILEHLRCEELIVSANGLRVGAAMALIRPF